jgi:hypothetical protein
MPRKPRKKVFEVDRRIKTLRTKELKPVKPIRETSLLTEDSIASVNHKLKKEIEDAKLKMDIQKVIELTNRKIRKRFKEDPAVIDFILKEKKRAKKVEKEFRKLLKKEKKDKRKLKKQFR